MTAAAGLAGTVRRVLDDRRVRYLGAGAVAASVYYLSFAGLWLTVSPRIPYVLLALVANFVTAVVMYPIQRCWVFRVTGGWVTGFLRFYLLCLGAAGMVLVGLPLLVEVVGLHVLVAQAIVIVGSPLINYQVGRRWAFHRPDPAAVPAGAEAAGRVAH